MKNKNNVVLTIIAIATILVTVIGATFAYFASTVDEGTGSNFTAVVEEDNVLFTATGSNMTMEVTADKMTQHASSSGTIVAAEAESEAINVSLTVGTEKPIMCKYNIYFQWYSSGTAYLNKTSGATKEFTASLSLDGGGTQGINDLISETQFTDVVTNTNKTLVVEGATITASASSSGSQTWSPTIKFYNLQLDQTALAGKSYKGTFTVDDVECSGVNTLSDTVIAKISEEDYTSSQDGSIYKIKHEKTTSVDAEKYTVLKQSEYGTVTEYRNYSATSVSGTSVSGMFDYNPSDNTYSNDRTNMAQNSYYHMVIPIQSDSYYRMCYKVNTVSSSNWLYAYVTDSGNTASGNQKLSDYIASSTSIYTCKDLGYLTNSQAVRIVQRVNTGIASVTFYLQKTNETINYDAGVRYEGKDPNNYVTFNGETAGWRIIGVFEGSTIGLEPGKQYTKIIRSTKIGNYAWDCKDKNGDGYCYDTGDSESDWTNSTLNSYLNGDYLASLSDSKKIAKYNENYSTWYLRGPDDYYDLYTQDFYAEERNTGQAGYRNGIKHAADTEINDAIGLMYPSDYGYAAYGANCDNTSSMPLSEYGKMEDWNTMEVSGCVTVDWLAAGESRYNEYEFFISPNPTLSPDNVFVVYGITGANVLESLSGGESAVRPTLYLEANLTATGTGTKLDPYVLN